MKTYCDTNILTAFVNRNQLGRAFGNKGFQRFKNHIKGQRDESSEEKLKNVSKCIIDRTSLINDIGNHQASVGAILTSSNLKDIEIKDINGFEEGKKAYNDSCRKVKRQSYFHKKFCKSGKLREDINKNSLNDISHFGSAIKKGCEIFVTSNIRDFKPLEMSTNIKIGGNQ